MPGLGFGARIRRQRDSKRRTGGVQNRMERSRGQGHIIPRQKGEETRFLTCGKRWGRSQSNILKKSGFDLGVSSTRYKWMTSKSRHSLAIPSFKIPQARGYRRLSIVSTAFCCYLETRRVWARWTTCPAYTVYKNRGAWRPPLDKQQCQPASLIGGRSG